MNFIESLGPLHISAKEIPCLTGKGAPTKSTEGAAGVLYMDIDTGDLYKCRGAENGGYHWKKQRDHDMIPAKGVDYYTDGDKAELVALVLDALQGKVVPGYVDSENNIVITNLPEGSYMVRYEMADGSMVEIGALELAGNEPDAPAYINQIPISTDADGNPLVGSNGEKGYKSGVRLSVSSGSESSSNAESYETTGFIPVLPGKNIYMKGVPIGDDGKHNICFYRADKSYIAGTTTKLFFDHSDGDVVYGALREVVTNASTAAFIRISSSEITADSIITVDEPIV